MRSLSRSLVVVLALAACKSEGKRAEPAAGSAPVAIDAAVAAAKPASAIELVQAAVPKGSKVAPADLKVDGIELFAATSATPSDEDYERGRLFGVAGGKLLEGRDLIKAVGETKADAKTIARIALWAYQEDGELLDKATGPEQTQAHVAAPARKGSVIKLWVFLADQPPVLERGTIDLTTGALDLGPLPAKPDVLISSAIRTMQHDNVRRYPRALDLLASTCAEPRSRQALFALLSSHAREQTRIAVTEVIHKCGPAAVDPLVFSMEHDKAEIVRVAAATALGRVGDGRARPALARAARGEDANLVYAAKSALDKIK
jgi:hypothetical protein